MTFSILFRHSREYIKYLNNDVDNTTIKYGKVSRSTDTDIPTVDHNFFRKVHRYNRLIMSEVGFSLSSIPVVARNFSA